MYLVVASAVVVTLSQAHIPHQWGSGGGQKVEIPWLAHVVQYPGELRAASIGYSVPNFSTFVNPKKWAKQRKNWKRPVISHQLSVISKWGRRLK
jgi:hypothetical protein